MHCTHASIHMQITCIILYVFFFIYFVLIYSMFIISYHFFQFWRKFQRALVNAASVFIPWEMRIKKIESKYIEFLNMYCRSEICISAPKYVFPLRNMYLRSEICIDTPKYVLTLRDTLSIRHAHVRKPSLCSKIWAPSHERVNYGLVPVPRPLTVLIEIPGSHRVPPLAKVLGKLKTFRRVGTSGGTR